MLIVCGVVRALSFWVEIWWKWVFNQSFPLFLYLLSKVVSEINSFIIHQHLSESICDLIRLNINFALLTWWWHSFFGRAKKCHRLLFDISILSLYLICSGVRLRNLVSLWQVFCFYKAYWLALWSKLIDSLIQYALFLRVWSCKIKRCCPISA